MHNALLNNHSQCHNPSSEPEAHDLSTTQALQYPFKALICNMYKQLQHFILQRLYYSPSILNELWLSLNACCLKCGKCSASLMHCLFNTFGTKFWVLVQLSFSTKLALNSFLGVDMENELLQSYSYRIQPLSMPSCWFRTCTPLLWYLFCEWGSLWPKDIFCKLCLVYHNTLNNFN